MPRIWKGKRTIDSWKSDISIFPRSSLGIRYTYLVLYLAKWQVA
jgi:hypothetical protein